MGSVLKWNLLLPVLGAIMVARAIVSGTAIPRTPPSHPTASNVARGEACGFQGNSDAYGFGIRLGIYLQWTAVILSCRFTSSSEARKELMDTHTLFSSAILIAIIALSVQVSSLHSIEIVILLYIWYTDASNSAATFTNRKEVDNSLIGLIYWILIYMGMGCYAVWFWYRGVYQFEHTPCGTYAFLFARVNVYGRGGAFFRAITTIYMVLISFTVIVTVGIPLTQTVYHSALATYRTKRNWRLQRRGIKDFGLEQDAGSDHVRGRLNVLVDIYLEPHRKILAKYSPDDKPLRNAAW